MVGHPAVEIHFGTGAGMGDSHLEPVDTHRVDIAAQWHIGDIPKGPQFVMPAVPVFVDVPVQRAQPRHLLHDSEQAAVRFGLAHIHKELPSLGDQGTKWLRGIQRVTQVGHAAQRRRRRRPSVWPRFARNPACRHRPAAPRTPASADDVLHPRLDHHRRHRAVKAVLASFLAVRTTQLL